ncbi:MAG TPA: heme o synthase [Phycisphaerae bacterium]|nr:heme o synthase [Phycisphaerae bacterium]
MQRIADYAVLTRARLASLVLFTTVAGYLLGITGSVVWSKLLSTLIGTGLTALAANAFNQWMEMHVDARMPRTRNRPLPAGAISPHSALAVALGMMLAGLILLKLAVNGPSAFLAAMTAVIYLAAYTPLKTRTSLCTLVGAVCGAIPPVIGWTAATGRVEGPAVILGAILLVWQVPHFLALAWLYREDYGRSGFRTLPMSDCSGESTGLMIVLYSLVLLPIGLTGVLVGLSGWAYAAASIALGLGLVYLAVRFYRDRSARNAKRLFHATLVYLPLLLTFMIADRGPAW